jgi:hypothetical protein
MTAGLNDLTRVLIYTGQIFCFLFAPGLHSFRRLP